MNVERTPIHIRATAKMRAVYGGGTLVVSPQHVAFCLGAVLRWETGLAGLTHKGRTIPVVVTRICIPTHRMHIVLTDETQLRDVVVDVPRWKERDVEGELTAAGFDLQRDTTWFSTGHSLRQFGRSRAETVFRVATWALVLGMAIATCLDPTWWFHGP